MKPLQMTDALEVLWSGYWNAYFMWERCKTDPQSSMWDWESCAMDMKRWFEMLVGECVSQHARQHGVKPSRADMRDRIKDNIVDVIKARYLMEIAAEDMD